MSDTSQQVAGLADEQTKGSHTPGPWSAEDPIDGQLSIVEANKPTHEWKFIATIYLREGNDPDEFTHRVSEANARLIAAAPELLTLCKQMKKWLEPELQKEPDRTYFWKLVEVIRKAEGK